MAKRIKGSFTELSTAINELPTVNMLSNKEAIIYGTRGVIEYTENHIRLNCNHIILSVSGVELMMKALSLEEIIIKGVILSINFSDNNGE